MQSELRAQSSLLTGTAISFGDAEFVPNALHAVHFANVFFRALGFLRVPGYSSRAVAHGVAP